MLTEHKKLQEQIGAAQKTALQLSRDGEQVDVILRGLASATTAIRTRVEYYEAQAKAPKEKPPETKTPAAPNTPPASTQTEPPKPPAPK